MSDEIPGLYPTPARAIQAVLRALLKRWPKTVSSERGRVALAEPWRLNKAIPQWLQDYSTARGASQTDRAA